MGGRETHATAAAGQKRGGKRKKGQCCSIVFCSSLPSSVARFHPPTPLCHGVVSCGTCHTARCFALIGALSAALCPKLGTSCFYFYSFSFFRYIIQQINSREPAGGPPPSSSLFPPPSLPRVSLSRTQPLGVLAVPHDKDRVLLWPAPKMTGLARRAVPCLPLTSWMRWDGTDRLTD